MEPVWAAVGAVVANVAGWRPPAAVRLHPGHDGGQADRERPGV